MRSDGAQLFPTYSPQTEPLLEMERCGERETEQKHDAEIQRKHKHQESKARRPEYDLTKNVSEVIRNKKLFY